MGDFNRYLTVAEVLNGAAVECGLAPSGDAFNSSDPSFIQLRYLLTTAGRELLGKSQWQQLRREYSQTVLYGGSDSYSLPADFDRFIDQTQWDRKLYEPLGGPLTAQDWQALKGNAIVVLPTTIMWRLDQDMIKIYPAPPATGTDPFASIYFEYVSRAWIRDATVSSSFRDAPAAGADIVLYDSLLIVKFLKFRFLGSKGFDTTDALQQYMEALSAAMDKGNPGEILSVAPSDCPNLTPWSGAIGNGLPA